MKFFNKNNDSNMPFGAGDIIKDETAAIISELGNNNAADDITFEPVQQAKRPQAAQPSHATGAPEHQQQVQSPPPQSATRQSTSPAEKPAPTAQQSSTTNAKTAANATLKFGIKDAIDLINSLPMENTDLVIPVVVKTLESANIHLDDIIGDADKHEKILETRSNRLIEQIEAMEAQVANLSDQVMNLNSQLEEITHVRELLSLSFGDDSGYESADLSDEEVAALIEEEGLDEEDVNDIKSAIDEMPISKNK